jgi:hypothetical protein
MPVACAKNHGNEAKTDRVEILKTRREKIKSLALSFTMVECPICMDADAVFVTETCSHPVCLSCFHRIYRTVEIRGTPHLTVFAEEHAIPEAVAIRMACWMEHQELYKMVEYSKINGCPVCRSQPSVAVDHGDWFAAGEEPPPGAVLPPVTQVRNVAGTAEETPGLLTLRQLLLEKEKLLDLYELQVKTEENLANYQYLEFFAQECVVQAVDLQYPNVTAKCPFPDCTFTAASHEVDAWARHINVDHEWELVCTECSVLSDVKKIKVTEVEKTDKVACLQKFARHFTEHHPGPLTFSENCCIYFCI